MRVDICGPQLVDPKKLRGQEPSLANSSEQDQQQDQTTAIQFSELNQFGVSLIGQKEEYNLEESVHSQSLIGFTFNEEEWSLFSKPHLDLEPYERKKMCSLPKSFTPFSLPAGEGGLEFDRNMNKSASNSIMLRKCESLSPTPSQFLLNGEPNNNTLDHPSSQSKILLLHKSQERFQEDEKENWLSDEGWPNNPMRDGSCTEFDQEEPYLSAWGIGSNKMSNFEDDFPPPPPRFPLTHSSSAVGTIGSHPAPISSCAEDQAHHHHHQDLSTCQPASFPVTVYNFNVYADCYDDWNANIASLCENNTTPLAYQEGGAPAAGYSGGPAPPFAVQQQDSRCEGYIASAEEGKTLSTFLSKFDDKVAAIWGSQAATGRSTLGSNFLSVDGCISSASTPLGSSNPWGSPSSDISSAQGPDYRIHQSQLTSNQVTLAADALLSAGFGFSQHELYQYEQLKAQSAAGRLNADLAMSPPNIMHSMKQYFGTAPSEGEYYIIRREESTLTEEGLKNSLDALNHSEETSGFAVFSSQEYIIPEEIDLNTMAQALDSIDLDNERDEEWEIVEASNRGGRTGYEGEDLLNSWKTHFRTVEQVECIAIARGIDLLESPVTAISAHQINPNLPEYRLFDTEVDGDSNYHVFKRAGHTIFPVKYKVFHQNEKANQTEDLGVDITSPIDPSQMLQAYKMATDFSKCLPTFDFSGGSLESVAKNATPIAPYDCDGNTEALPSEWNMVLKGAEYNGTWGEWALGDENTNALYPVATAEYCDSGVDGVGSRSDFYDDMFGDYDGDLDNFSGMGFAFAAYTAANEGDTDYGQQFQDATSVSGCDSSSVSGKQPKSNKRSKTRLRPCKYYFLEGSCRRGSDCKFSHDSVTCRYWAEGSCLKGQNCPYVHCFIDGRKLVNPDEKEYQLESEADFPALGSSKGEMQLNEKGVLGMRRLEDSLESLTVFTDSNSSVVEEEVVEPRRLFLFERLRAASPKLATSGKQEPNHHEELSTEFAIQENSDLGRVSRNLSKSKSLGDANASTGRSVHEVNRSNSHTFSTGSGSTGHVKEKRKKKRH